MKKICHLTSVHPPLDSRIFYRECQTLVRAGYSVLWMGQHTHEEVCDGVIMRTIPPATGRRSRMSRTLYEICRKAIQERADLYHFHDPELIPVGILLKLLGKKVIYDVHEDYPRSLRTSDRQWIHPRLRGVIGGCTALVEKIGSFFFDGIAAATPAIASRFPSPRKTILVQNFPIGKELLTPEARPHSERPPHLAYTGVLSPFRGATQIIESMGLLSNHIQARLQVAGRIDPPELIPQLQQLAGWKRVDFLGWQSRPRMAELLGQARAGLLLFHPVSNHTQSQPNKMFEYMSAGIPVIASNFPLWRSLVEGNQCGINCDPLNPKEVAEAIEWLLAHPQKAQRMGENGRRAVEEKYNWESESKTLIAFYQKLMPEKP